MPHVVPMPRLTSRWTTPDTRRTRDGSCGSPASLREGGQCATSRRPTRAGGSCGVSFRLTLLVPGAELRCRGQRVGVGGGQSAEHTLPGVRAHAQRGERGRAPSEVGSSRRRATSRPRLPSTRTRSTRPTGPATCTRSTGRPARSSGRRAFRAASGSFLRQGANHASGDGRQGDRRHPGRHPLRGRPGREGARVQQVHRCARLEHQVDPHFAAIITQSPTVFDGKVYVGVASQEEALAAFVPGYVLSFRGSMLALDLATGAILWKTYMAPRGLHGQRRLGQLAGDRHEARSRSTSRPGTTTRCPPAVLACVAGCRARG